MDDVPGFVPLLGFRIVAMWGAMTTVTFEGVHTVCMGARAIWALHRYDVCAGVCSVRFEGNSFCSRDGSHADSFARRRAAVDCE